MSAAAKWVLFTPLSWFSKCGPHISRSSITWELVRNANSWDPSQTYQIRDSRRGPPAIYATKKKTPSDVSDTHPILRTTALIQKSCFPRFHSCIYPKLSTLLHRLDLGKEFVPGNKLYKPPPLSSTYCHLLSESLQGPPACLPTTGSGHSPHYSYMHAHIHIRNTMHTLKPEGSFQRVDLTMSLSCLMTINSSPLPAG